MKNSTSLRFKLSSSGQVALAVTITTWVMKALALFTRTTTMFIY
jgi:hypothetical protein